MLKSAADRASQAREVVADLLEDETVHAAAECTWPGQFGALLAFQAIPVVGFVLSRKGRKRAHGLPQQFVLAVTGDRIVAFGQPKANWNVNTVKVTKELLSFPVTQAVVSTRQPPAGLELTIDIVGGETISVHAAHKSSGQSMVAAIEELAR